VQNVITGSKISKALSTTAMEITTTIVYNYMITILIFDYVDNEYIKSPKGLTKLQFIYLSFKIVN